METVIRTENISKNYKDVKAASEINLAVRKGEIYGFLGLNGAGKTTTIRMLLGLINPSSGAAFINQQKVNASQHELWNKIGYLVETPHAYPNLTVKENLHMISQMRFIKDKNAVNQIIEKMELGAYANRKTKNLSLGNAQRLGLAKALIHNPEILILDEPTNGLDPAGIHDIREMLKDLAINQGVTVFISSHILSEISLFANRIGIVHHGKMVQEIDTKELDILCKKQLVIQTKDLKAALFTIQEKGYQQAEIHENTILIEDEKAIKNPEEIASLLVHAGNSPSLLNIKEENLESYFLNTIKQNGGIK